jgi:hypothetical protein
MYNRVFFAAGLAMLAFQCFGQQVTVTRIEQTDPSIVYTGTWYVNNESPNSGGSAALTNAKGATATLSFTGTGINWIGVLDPYSGIAQVYLDSTQYTVDTYGPSTLYQQHLFAVHGLAPGAHTLSILVPHVRDANTEGSWIWIDAFDIENGSGIIGGVSAAAGRAEQNNPAITYTGNWYPDTNAVLSGGTAVSATAANSSATVTFTGTGITWIGYRDQWSGIANVYVDGNLQSPSVDTFAASEQAQAPVYSISGLSSGTHSLMIVATGTHDAASAGSWIWVDAFDVAGPIPLAAQTASLTAAVSNGAFQVNLPAGFSWTATSNDPWITITSGASGTGSGTVSFSVQANTGAARTGTIMIAGQTFTIEQVSASAAGLGFAGSMAQIASGGGWDTSLTLMNLGTTSAEMVLNFFDDNGNALLLPLTFPQSSSTTPLLASTLDQTIDAGAELVIQTAGTASQATVDGWVQLLANGGNIGGSAVFACTTSSGPQEAVVPIETRNPSAFVLPFDYTGGYATGVALANLSNQAVSVAVVLRDDTGASLGAAAAISLPAYAHSSFMLATSYPAVAGKFGTMELDTPTGGQISALGIRAAPDGAITTVPVLAVGAVSDGSIAQLASGGLWNTSITLVNTGTAAAQVSLKFYDDNGNALLLPLIFPQTSSTTSVPTSTLNQTINGESQLVIQTAGTASQTTSEGWAQLVATGGNIGGSAIFGWTTAAGTQEAAAPVQTRNPTAFVLSFDDTGGYATGVALTNLSNQAVSVPVVLRDDTGASLGAAAAIQLPAYAHTSFMLATSYPAVSGRFGTLELDTPAGGQISALGIRATPGGAITSVPVLAK